MKSVKRQIDVQALVTAIVVGIACALMATSLLVAYFANAFNNWPVS